jgi:hypothetical protein
MRPNIENNQNKESTSIWSKVGAFVTKGEQILGRSLVLPFNSVIYTVSPSSWRKSWSERWNDCKNGISHVISNQGEDFLVDRVGISLVKIPIYPAKPSNWLKSYGEISHDIKNGVRYVTGNQPEEYNSPIGTLQASKDLGMQIIGYGKGRVKFRVSRILTGDIPHLSPEQLDKIKKDLTNITIDREGSKIIIEIDVKKIINDIKADPNNEGISEEQIKKLAIKKIEQEVDHSLKGIAKITDGELKKHTDLKLLYGIAEKLYQGYDDKKEDTVKSSETVKPIGMPSETIKSVGSNLSKEVISRIAEPLINSGETVRSVESKNNESRELRVNRPQRTTGM